MFICASDRKKNGKSHIYHRVMEKRCVAGGRWVQRQVAYLGELTSAQEDSLRGCLATEEDSLLAKPVLRPVDREYLAPPRDPPVEAKLGCEQGIIM